MEEPKGKKVELNNMETTTTTTTKNFPSDLIAEILSWLPAKYLWPLRYVCKAWFHLLTTDPQFAKSNFDRSIQLKPNLSIIVRRAGTFYKDYNKFYLATDHTECDKAIQLVEPPLRPNQEYDSSCVVYGVCNGLLCVSHLNIDHVYIWNPLTNHHIGIPYPPNPSKCMTTRFGFGFIQSTNEYKLIKLAGGYNSEEGQTQLSVCTLCINSSWRTVEEDMGYEFSHQRGDGTHINGVVHWFATKGRHHSLHTIAAFDLNEELLNEITPPTPNDFDFDGEHSFSWIGELGGFLCMFFGSYGWNIQIWTMKEYGVSNSWTKEFKIGCLEVVGNNIIYLVPLGVVGHNGEIILEKNDRQLIIYNRKTNSIDYPKEFGFPFHGTHAYFGSIISPRAFSGAGHFAT